MRFRLSVSDEMCEEITAFLSERGIELADDAPYVITEAQRYPSFISVRNGERESMRLAADEIVCIEAFGKDIEVHTERGTYLAQERIYRLEELLDPKEFIRISKSVIISKRHVKKIRPALSMKFVLTLSDGRLVDVTRSYYSEFKRFFGF